MELGNVGVQAKLIDTIDISRYSRVVGRSGHPAYADHIPKITGMEAYIPGMMAVKSRMSQIWLSLISLALNTVKLSGSDCMSVLLLSALTTTSSSCFSRFSKAILIT